MSRIPGTFRRLAKSGEAALITYLPAGVPSLDVTRRLLPIVARQGADLIVIGATTSISGDSLDGLERAEASLADCISIAAEARRSNEVPLVLLAHHADVHAHGLEVLASECGASGVDALFVPDLPLAFAGPLAEARQASGVDLVLAFSTPGDVDRMAELSTVTGGFVYVAEEDEASLASLVEEARLRTELPVVVLSHAGSPDDVAALARLADGVLVADALLPFMAGAEEELMLDVSEAVRALKAATPKAAPTR
jgi:tryptophan synthase alpha chain